MSKTQKTPHKTSITNTTIGILIIKTTLLYKLLRHCHRAEKLVWGCQHIEILASLYNSFVSGKEQYYIILCESIYKNVKRWDTTKKGFEEFMALDQEARNKFEAEKNEREQQMETIRKAREQGKKVDFVFEKGKIVPVVIEETKN